MSRVSDNFWNSSFARNFVLYGALLLLAQVSALADQSVTLTWNPSPISNVAGYKIYYGGASRVYTNTVTLGNITNVTISGLNEGATYYFGATTVDASGKESDFSNEATYVIPLTVTNIPTGGATNSTAASQPPTLDAIANLTIFQNAGLQTVVLTGITSGSASGNQNLVVSAVSSDSNVVPTPAVNYVNPNNSGMLSFAPATDALGTATVIVTVDNGSTSNNLTTQTFTITVVPVPVVNQPPTLNAITNMTISQNAGVQTIVLTGITSGSPDENQTLTVTAVSSDYGIISPPTVNYASPNSTGTLTFAPMTNALGTATVTLMLNDGAGSNNIVTRTFTVTVKSPAMLNQQPTLEPIANVSLVQGAGAQTITLTGITSGSSAENQVLKVSAISSNPRFVPTPAIRYISPSATAQLTFKPIGNGTGTATITVTINDGGKSNNVIRRTFTISVLRNKPPTLDPISNASAVQGAAAQSIMLTGITSGSPVENQVLSVSAMSSNPRLVPAPAVRYASPGTTALLTFKPAGNFAGKATITVVVNDGGRDNNITLRRFTVTVPAQASSNSISTSVPAGNAQAVASSTAGSNPAATLTTPVNIAGTFSFQVTGISGGKYIVQTSSDLVRWNSVQTNTAPFTFQDNGTKGVSRRFYRAAYLP